MEESDRSTDGWKRLLRLDLEVRWVRELSGWRPRCGGRRLVDGSRFLDGSASPGVEFRSRRG